MDESQKLQDELSALKARNARVDADKAWETSLFRKVLILVITYILAAVVMWTIGVPNYFLSACIPTLGYFLSTLSLSVVKGWWVKRFFQ